ncbi:MAG: hypothetical protein R3E82_18985 [Pseudomonadales bacterium]|nr:hypothetical protein [Pseudomonadales bacterium]
MKAEAALHIGLTYDLRDEYLAQGYSEEETAEFDQPGTIDALGNALEALGYRVDRIGNAVALMQRLSAGGRWDLVFNIAEGLNGYGREAQVPAILDVYGIPYTFGDPLTASVCLHKAWAKTLVAAVGVRTAQHQVISRIRDCGDFRLPLPVLLKPIAEGTGKGVTPESVITDPKQLAPAAKAMLARYRQPVLVEEFLPGREFTVGILGTGTNARVLGSLEIRLRDEAEQGVYSYVNKEQCESLVDYPYVCDEPVVEEAQAIALKAWIALGCRDGGRVDLRCDSEGRPVFMEVNPLAGLHPTHSDLPMLATAIGMPYVELIREIVESAAERVAGRRAPADSQAA